MELDLERNDRETGWTCHPTGSSYKQSVFLFVSHIKKCMGILKRLCIVSLHRETILLTTLNCDKKAACFIGETRTVAPLSEAERENQVVLN